MWKSAYVGVYQLLNWKIHGETLKLIELLPLWALRGLSQGELYLLQIASSVLPVTQLTVSIICVYRVTVHPVEVICNWNRYITNKTTNPLYMQDHAEQEINVSGNVCSRQNNEIGHVNGLLDPGESSENRKPCKQRYTVVRGRKCLNIWVMVDVSHRDILN